MGKKNTKETLADETDKLVHQIIEQGVDCVIGGFPCQDISGANRKDNGGTGLAGSRSGLFWAMVDTVRMVRPSYWLMENVAALFQQQRQSDMGLYSQPWPPAGIISNGIAYRREALAHPTIGLEHTFLPTPCVSESKGTSRNRFKGSPSFHNTKVSEALRTCEADPCYLDASFAEAIQGLPKDYTALETETHPAS